MYIRTQRTLAVGVSVSERYVQDQEAIHFIFDHFQEEMMQPIDDSIKTVKALKKMAEQGLSIRRDKKESELAEKEAGASGGSENDL